MTTEEFCELQQNDPTLQETWTAIREKKLSGDKFFMRDDILYREWIPPGQSGVIEQLVLPQKCRAKVLELAHRIPLAGHLGRDKTASRLLYRFYWQSLYKDVKLYCQQCDVCQKTRSRKPRCVPLIPLPILEEPFQRVGMDIVGPLPIKVC